jgi:F-type H+-transporting ATPase subunit b
MAFGPSDVVVVGLLSGQSSGGGVTVDFDWTLFIQIGFIVVLFVVLKPMLFDPMLKLFEERERRIDGARKEARKIDEESAMALGKYEAAMAKARAEGNAVRDRERAAARAAETDILAKMRGEVQDYTDGARKNLAQDLSRAQAELSPQSRTLARSLAARLLGREVA